MTGSILIVDDSKAVQLHLKILLGQTDYTLSFADNGTDACRLAEETIPDLVLLDVMLPDLSGYEVCAQLKANPRTRDIPVIFVSSHTEVKEIVHGLKLGAVDFLSKPTEKHILLTKANTLVRWSQDARARRKLEMELHQMNKLESIGQLAAGIAHEINTPIQFVNDNLVFVEDAVANLLSLQEPFERLLAAATEAGLAPEIVEEIRARTNEADLGFLREELPEAVKESRAGTARVTGIVQAMTAFSHPGGFEMLPVRLDEAIKTTITVTRNRWKKVAEVETDFDHSLPPVPCLVSEFNQVILNLILNACDAIAEKRAEADPLGKIVISTRQEAGEAIIRVTDSGTGIPAAIQARVFDPFFTTREVGKGSGQGLAIARSVIVDKHRGRLSFESTEGDGTTFMIALRLATRA